MAYAFEASLTNEFHNRMLPCSPENLVPQGPGILSANQGCAIAGALPGNTSISGDDYLQAQFSYERSHLWRNFGVVIAFGVLYLLVCLPYHATLIKLELTPHGSLLLPQKPSASSEAVAARSFSRKQKPQRSQREPQPRTKRARVPGKLPRKNKALHRQPRPEPTKTSSASWRRVSASSPLRT